MRSADLQRADLVVGAAGGLVAGIAMGVVLQLGTDLMPAIGALSGEQSVVIGWVVHLIVSTAAGLSFALFVSIPVFHEVTRSVSGCAIVGILHAFGVAAVLVGMVLPVLVNFVGTPTSGLAFPFGSVPGPELEAMISAGMFGLAHVIYGVVLGAVFAYGRHVRSDGAEAGPSEESGGGAPGGGKP